MGSIPGWGAKIPHAVAQLSLHATIRKKEIIKIRAETNEKEMKEAIVKINKTKIWFFEKINKIDNH